MAVLGLATGRTLRIGILFALVAGLASCGSTGARQGRAYMGSLPRPEVVVVYPFASSPQDVNVHLGLGADLRGDASHADRTRKEIEAGRELADAIADQLVAHIDDMGLPARRGTGPPPTDMRSVVIGGAIVSVDEGNAEERAVIGLGSGRSSMSLSVHVFEYLPEGRREIDSFEVDATGGWKPGAAETGIIGLAAGANPAAMVLTGLGTTVASEKLSAGIDATAKHSAERTAKVLERFFSQHGWI